MFIIIIIYDLRFTNSTTCNSNVSFGVSIRHSHFIFDKKYNTILFLSQERKFTKIVVEIVERKFTKIVDISVDISDEIRVKYKIQVNDITPNYGQSQQPYTRHNIKIYFYWRKA